MGATRSAKFKSSIYEYMYIKAKIVLTRLLLQKKQKVQL